MAYKKKDLIARQKAIDEGLTQYVRPSDGELYTIRNLDNKRHSKNYDGQGGRDEKYVSRNGNRGNKPDNPRAFNLRHGSPPGTDIAEGDRAMARIRRANPGMDADHVHDIALTSNGASWKVQQGRGTYQEYFENFEKAGIPVGHVEGNLKPLDPHLNQIVKNQQTAKVHDAIQKAGSKSDEIFGAIRRSKASKVFGVPLIGGAVAAVTDFATTGNAASAVGAFVDAENPLDSGALANGTRTANTNPKPVPVKPLGNVLLDQIRRGVDWYRNTMNAF